VTASLQCVVVSARIVVLDSVTQCQGRVQEGDVLVAGSFAGALSLRLALPFGIRGLIAHAAGIGKDAAGISALGVADTLAIPAAAVDTMSARIGDGPSVHGDGVISHANAAARALGVEAGMSARDAARRLTRAGPPRALAAGLTHETPRVVDETAAGRVVCVDTLSFATSANAGDVVCAGSHSGRVNIEALLRIVKPRGVVASDGGMARDRSGISGLARLEDADVAGAAVDTMSARIGDGPSVHDDGVISHANTAARALGVEAGMTARDAARRLTRAGPPRALAGALAHETPRVLDEIAIGRVVCVDTLSFVTSGNAGDVVCAGSDSGRVNIETLLRIVKPRGVIASDGGMARERSGISGLALLDDAGVAAAAVDAMSARIGDGRSTWQDGVVSAVNARADRAGVMVGQPARVAARQILH